MGQHVRSSAPLSHTVAQRRPPINYARVWFETAGDEPYNDFPHTSTQGSTFKGHSSGILAIPPSIGYSYAAGCRYLRSIHLIIGKGDRRLDRNHHLIRDPDSNSLALSRMAADSNPNLRRKWIQIVASRSEHSWASPISGSVHQKVSSQAKSNETRGDGETGDEGSTN